MIPTSWRVLDQRLKQAGGGDGGFPFQIHGGRIHRKRKIDTIVPVILPLLEVRMEKFGRDVGSVMPNDENYEASGLVVVTTSNLSF